MIGYRWTVHAYCPTCGDSLVEMDGTTIDEAREDGVEARAEWIWDRHVAEFHSPGVAAGS